MVEEFQARLNQEIEQAKSVLKNQSLHISTEIAEGFGKEPSMRKITEHFSINLFFQVVLIVAVTAALASSGGGEGEGHRRSQQAP